jgi:hypothetical protein
VRMRSLLVLVGFVATLFAGAAWGRAQAVAPKSTEPVVVSGSDMGFRITSRKGDTPIGQFVIRQNGTWVAVEMSGGVRLVK